ncbi:MAG: hypothetical protein M0Q51_08505 [Bacteroidales bacterium]|nr:hypothetical protein [Bacteroidales bacterium]
MRTLIYVPIIHSSADMGSLGKELKNKSVSELGENVWQKHTDTVNGYWDAIESYFENIDIYIKGIKIYQDGMFVDGEIAMKIINEGIKSGSKNFEIVSNLIDRGASLIKTEDFKMVKDEYDGLQSILKSKTNIKKLFLLLRYKVLKPIFLIRRDKFITGRIAETLGQNETGILFIGAYHNIMKRLPKDITVIELKEIAKIRKYQKAIQSDSKIKTLQLKQLTEYLIKK